MALGLSIEPGNTLPLPPPVLHPNEAYAYPEVEHPSNSQLDDLVSLLPVLFPHHFFLSVLNLPRTLYPYTLLPYYPKEE